MLLELPGTASGRGVGRFPLLSGYLDIKQAFAEAPGTSEGYAPACAKVTLREQSSMFTPGTPRPANAGRKVGTPNRATREAQALADELDIDPFKVLLLFAAGDTEALGLKPYVDGKGRQRDPMVPLDLRMQAAVAACRHLLPTLRSVEVSGPDGGPIEAMMALGEEGIAKRRAEIEMALDQAI